MADVADYNGDVCADILRRHSSGEIGQWRARSDGGLANNRGAVANAVDPSWKIVASGDLEGDGRKDRRDSHMRSSATTSSM